jgi:hypothetical protein
MEREFKKAFGKQLRKEFQVSDGLPASMVRALGALTAKYGDNDNLPAVASGREGATGTNAPLPGTAISLSSPINAPTRP